MKTDFIIIGGGVAGLSAANHLAENGAHVLLLEGGTYPAHKICGEFVSPEALPLLENWDIPPPALMHEVQFVTPHKRWSMKLPSSAASYPRFFLDDALAKRAAQKGALIKTGAFVKNITEHYRVTLSSGEEFYAPNLLMSTGRLKGTPTFRYVGFKAHFEGKAKELKMHLFPNAYVGISPIGKNSVNIAGLIACSSKEAETPKKTVADFLKKYPLERGVCLYDDWLAAPVPEFGVRQDPKWPNTYLVGDAAGVIPPAAGSGLSMSLHSGILAAEYALRNDPEGYRAAWKEHYKRMIFHGKILHRIYLNSRLAPLMPFAGPALTRYWFTSSRPASTSA